MQVIEYDKVKVEEETYTTRDKTYRTIDLIKEVENQKLIPFDLPLIGVNLSRLPFEVESLDQFAWHCKRVQETDLSNPIILDVEGAVCNGNHRIVKAIIEGKEKIKAYRLKYMPELIIE